MSISIKKIKVLLIVMLATTAIKVGATDLKPIMLDKGELIFSEGFSGTLNPEEWSISKGSWSIENQILKGIELKSDDHPAVIAKPVPFRNVVIQFDFRFDGCSEINFSTNDMNGHNTRVIMTSSGFTMSKDTNKKDPADSGIILGYCAYTFEQGKWYSMVVEYFGDEMLARIDDNAFILAANSYIDQDRISVRFPIYGDSVSLDNIKVWQGTLNKNWSETRLSLRETQKTRNYEDPKVAFQIAKSTLSNNLLKNDPDFKKIVERSQSISLKIKKKYPEASIKSKTGMKKRDRLMVEDAVFKKLHEDLKQSLKSEYNYLQIKDPHLAELNEQIRTAVKKI